MESRTNKSNALVYLALFMLIGVIIFSFLITNANELLISLIPLLTFMLFYYYETEVKQ